MGNPEGRSGLCPRMAFRARRSDEAVWESVLEKGQVLEMRRGEPCLEKLGKQEETSEGRWEVASDTGENPETPHNGLKRMTVFRLSSLRHADPVPFQNTYMGYLDYRKQTIKDLGISPSTCSFNPGVIVANMTEWKHQRITKQLERWMQKNVEYVQICLTPLLPPPPLAPVLGNKIIQ